MPVLPYCPLPAAMSPHADAAQAWLDARSPHYAPMRFARYAARLYPDASAADLRLLSAVFTWFFELDDTADAVGAPPLDALLARATEVFHGRPGEGALPQLWAELSGRMPPMWRVRFLDAVRHHFDGLRAEERLRRTGRTPGVADYVELRRATSAGYVAHALIEVVTGTPLPDAIYHHPAVRAYAAAGNDLLSWFNDLVSVDRDGDGPNLVRSLAAQRGLPMDAAVVAAGRMWQGRMAGLADLRSAVPDFGPVLDRFLDGVDHAVRGTLDWTAESARYLAVSTPC